MEKRLRLRSARDPLKRDKILEEFFSDNLIVLFLFSSLVKLPMLASMNGALDRAQPVEWVRLPRS
jgi:hypothetical protein